MKSDEITRKIKTIRVKLDKKKQQKAELEGQKKQIVKQLNEKFGVDSVEEAQDLCDDYEKKITTGDKKLKELLDKLDVFAEELE